MTDVSQPGTVRRTPRWVLAVLVLSLALNLVVIGLVGGIAWKHRKGPPGVESVIPNLLGYASTLSMERRKQIWELTREERQHIRPFRREVRAAREETIKALLAEPFDQETFRRTQARQAEAENRAREAVQDLYIKIAGGLTAEERRAFPRWRQHRRPPGQNLLDEPDQSAGEPKK